MAPYDYESRRLNTSRIVNKAIKKTFGDVSPLTDLYFKVSRLNIMICEELEKESLVWETKIREEFDKKHKDRRNKW